MRCETMRKRLSDLLDGALAPKERGRLEAHLRDCPACRAYRADLVRLQAGPTVDLSPEYWAGFERRLASKLDSVEAGRRPAGAPGFPRRRLAWAAAGFLVLAAAGTYFALIRPGAGTIETAWVAYEDPLAPLLQDAETDPEFGSLVNREILASIGDMTPVLETETYVPAADDPLFWEGLSDAELEFIAAELRAEDKKVTGLGGPK
jgi:hypothetical protein